MVVEHGSICVQPASGYHEHCEGSRQYHATHTFEVGCFQHAGHQLRHILGVQGSMEVEDVHHCTDIHTRHWELNVKW